MAADSMVANRAADRSTAADSITARAPVHSRIPAPREAGEASMATGPRRIAITAIKASTDRHRRTIARAMDLRVTDLRRRAIEIMAAHQASAMRLRITGPMLPLTQPRITPRHIPRRHHALRASLLQGHSRRRITLPRITPEEVLASQADILLVSPVGMAAPQAGTGEAAAAAGRVSPIEEMPSNFALL